MISEKNDRLLGSSGSSKTAEEERTSPRHQSRQEFPVPRPGTCHPAPTPQDAPGRGAGIPGATLPHGKGGSSLAVETCRRHRAGILGQPLPMPKRPLALLHQAEAPTSPWDTTTVGWENAPHFWVWPRPDKCPYFKDLTWHSRSSFVFNAYNKQEVSSETNLSTAPQKPRRFRALHVTSVL